MRKKQNNCNIKQIKAKQFTKKYPKINEINIKKQQNQ